jgi:hypothetical protein
VVTEKEKTIYQRLNSVRVELQKLNLKKSGRNAFAGFDYYELCDFVPAINALCEKYNLTTIFSVKENIATLEIFDSICAVVSIRFDMPFEQPSIKGANAVQNLGGAITYLRRYLFMTAFEIVESDVSDALIGKEEKAQPKKEAPKQSPKQPDKTNPNLEKLRTEIGKAATKKMKEIGEEKFKQIMIEEEIASIDIKSSNDFEWLKSVLNVITTLN